MTFDTRGYTMMGVSPEAGGAALLAAGADAIGGNCGNGPDELLPVIEKMHAVAPDAVLVAKSNAGMPELVDLRAVYRAEPPIDGRGGARVPGRRRPDHRRVLRLDAGPPRRDGRGARRRSGALSVAAQCAAPSARRSPASIRTGRRFSAGVSGQENCGA